mmetsp:Transcript_5594/g.6750  ORF Transcript_5594/g.6750 Transcript_5594/m.6750 type:complete len:211 (-) Transcript_5594:1484-2116(-)
MVPNNDEGFAPSLATLAIHGGNQKDKGHNAIVPPITTATSFVQESLDSAAGDFCYSRCGNPTRYAYETCLASLEEGTYATATASGVAAISLALELVPKDSKVLVMKGVYGGTHRLFEKVRRRNNGILFEYVDLQETSEIQRFLTDGVEMIWIETPTNPLLNLVDIAKVCSIAQKQKILVSFRFLTMIVLTWPYFRLVLITHLRLPGINSH